MGNLDMAVLQQIWWLLVAVIGSLFLFLNFVQGGQSLLWQVGKTDTEKSLVINSLGRKWELTFTTLVLFGGALFAAFPKFYATSFGGAYWVWMLILFTFILQAVSFEYRKKPDNLYGSSTYEFFLLINGTLGILLIGAAVGTFFTGSNFTLNDFNQVSWTHPLRGLEAAFSLFNLSFGLFLVFNSRVLGSLYLLNNIDLTDMEALERRLRKACLTNLICALPFLLYLLISLLTMDGFGVGSDGAVSMVAHKYLQNLTAMPITLGLLLLGLILIIYAVFITAFKKSYRAIWPAGLGTFFVGLALFFTAGYNGTSFYPSKVDLQSSLTIYNASSSHYTLATMAYVALIIPFVLAYIIYFWKQMDNKKLSLEDINDKKAY
ncbi:cytochrome d ubiquinol oxidase subunit II [Desulfotalea psychrophila]|uniref:Probable cytochrome d ubiquinol oxidase, subunit II n=1 Tax=Desulfotalea psychrophila (strain LSv54 / DSM 12343) TaxID=177439 RepID=Q6APS0_DESPS|nr:cytochrome d ubiquinol oxidase subunit II [Desulfotalea psychrophila]CAG35654.1 probable cytochrome d ubiquinol oxidase, subunit II [Desulfotalea psychrophila LSv54]